MRIPFSEMPGRHERHYRRKADNLLFAESSTVPTDSGLLEAQRLDHEELVQFMSALRDLVQRVVDLRPTEDSQVVLDIKAELDRAYETASTLAEDQSGNKDAIRTLTAVIMSAVRYAAIQGDPMAEQQLDDEDEARRIHYRLMEYSLVADLLAPDSVIRPEELAATLLSSTEAEVGAAVELFDHDQLALLCRDARSLVAKFGDRAGMDLSRPLAVMESRLAELAKAGHGRDAGNG